MKTFEELKAEAIARGIKPGAVCKSPYGTKWTVGPVRKWEYHHDSGLNDESHGDDPFIYCDDEGWATVITPAPEDQPEGLVDGMACEPDEHMRRAIVEKASEFQFAVGIEFYTSKRIAYFSDCGVLKNADMIKPKTTLITPGEFYDRLCKTFKPEPRIRIGGHHVEFNNGSIRVGCTDIPNDIVRKVFERLKD